MAADCARTRVLLCSACTSGTGVGAYLHDLLVGIPRDRFEMGLCVLHRRSSLPPRLLGLADFEADTPCASQRSPRLISFIRSVVKAFRPHVVHTHSLAGHVFARLALGRKSRIPVLSTFHSGLSAYFRYQRRSLRTAIEAIALRYVLRRMPGHGAAPSRGVAQEYERSFPKLAPVHVVWPTVSLHGSSCPASADATGLRSELGIEEGVSVVLSTGYLGCVKNQMVLLEAFARCTRDGPQAHLLLAGAEGTHGYSARLRARAHELRVSDAVSILGLRNDVSALLGLTDVWVMTSRVEGLSIAMLEAMQAGRAIICTSVGDTRAVVKDGVNGLLVPVDDIGSTACALARVLRDEELRLRLGSAARETVCDGFSPERMGQEYAAIYEALTARGGTRP